MTTTDAPISLASPHVDACLERAREQKQRVVVMDVPPGMGFVTELTRRSAQGAFTLVDLTDAGHVSALGGSDPMKEVREVLNRTAQAAAAPLLVLVVHAPVHPHVQHVLDTADKLFGTGVAYTSIIVPLTSLRLAERVRAQRAAEADPTAPSVVRPSL